MWSSHHAAATSSFAAWMCHCCIGICYHCCCSPLAHLKMRRSAAGAAPRLSRALLVEARAAALPPSSTSRRWLRVTSSIVPCRASPSSLLFSSRAVLLPLRSFASVPAAVSVRDRAAGGAEEAYLMPRAFLVTTQTLPGHRVRHSHSLLPPAPRPPTPLALAAAAHCPLLLLLLPPQSDRARCRPRLGQHRARAGQRSRRHDGDAAPLCCH
jgi:hypothetical protein